MPDVGVKNILFPQGNQNYELKLLFLFLMGYLHISEGWSDLCTVAKLEYCQKFMEFASFFREKEEKEDDDDDDDDEAPQSWTPEPWPLVFTQGKAVIWIQLCQQHKWVVGHYTQVV